MASLLKSFLHRKNLQQELQDVCLSHRLDAVVAMTISFNDQSEKPVRQLALYSQSAQYRRQVGEVGGTRTRIIFMIRITETGLFCVTVFLLHHISLVSPPD